MNHLMASSAVINVHGAKLRFSMVVAFQLGNYAIAHCGAQFLFHCTLCMHEGVLESYCTLRTVILNLPIKVKYVHRT